MFGNRGENGIVAGAVGHIASHYSHTAATLTYYPPLEEDRDCSICVIGGGLAGLAATLRLAQAGHDVILLEARRLAWAASGRNGGFVSPGFAESIFNIERRFGLAHTRELYRASVEGVGAIRNLIRASGRHEIIGGHGWLKMIRHGRTDELERRAERMARDYNANLQFVDRGGLQEYVSTEIYHAGLLDMAPFHIQPLEFASLVASLASGVGARLHENSPVSKVSRHGTGWRVDTGSATVKTDQVVLATSVYGGPSARVNSAMIPVSTYVITVHSRSGGLGNAVRFEGCLGDTRRASDYYRLVGPANSRQLLWGGRITTDRSKPESRAVGLLRDIRSVYPQLQDLEIGRAWSGQMGYAVHKMPIIGPIGDGLWVTSAFGGHGLNTAMMAGGLIADAISDRDDRIKLFAPFGAVWAGGPAGRIAAQAEYWRLQVLDWIGERLARGGG